MGIGQELPGKPFGRGEVIPVQALGHEPAEGHDADIGAGAQAFEGGARAAAAPALVDCKRRTARFN